MTASERIKEAREATDTTFGSVARVGASTVITAHNAQLAGWASNPYASWPCSALRHYDRVTVTFDGGDLVELAVIENGLDVEAMELAADELNAWSSECLIRAGYPNHPAIRKG